MKNLLDELKELDKENFEVSEDFSKKVISKVNKNNKIIILKRATSIAAVACIVVCTIIVGSKLGLKDRIMNFASDSVTQINSVSSGLFSVDSAQMSLSPLADDSREDNYNTTSKMEIADVVEEYVADVEENTIPEAEMDSIPAATQSNKTFSKQMNQSDYINEIHKLLDDNIIENTIISESQIEINSTDINLIYNIVEMYVDVELELKENSIVLTIK